mmetsp:Transcript_35869/g.81705  ORF Transcript_35869/g.81705 Transcript_35869/m.81705 type:complete len:333 (-) Transcript_35869:762-1760(-)
MSQPRCATLSEFLAVVASSEDCLSDADPVLKALEDFIEVNSDPATSPNFDREETDNVEELVNLLRDPRVIEDERMTLALLRTWKILSRKVSNRGLITPAFVEALALFLREPKNVQIASEAASVVLNICYEKKNVTLVLESGGVPALVSYLSATDEEVQANSSGALQSICFQELGREYLRDIGVIPAIVPLLQSLNVKVRTRAVGVVHNMSSDGPSIGAIRREGGIIPLIGLLRAPQLAICGSAAGALQNISRETASQEVILANDGVPLLTDLLFGSDIMAQAAASGALLNLMGEDGTEKHERKRDAMKKILALSLTTGMVFHGLYTHDDTPD